MEMYMKMYIYENEKLPTIADFSMNKVSLDVQVESITGYSLGIMCTLS